MKAIVVTQPGAVSFQELPTPEPGYGQARIRTSVCAICASDLTTIDGSDRIRYPAILGHEWCGIVDRVGPDGDATLLDRLCVAENVLADGSEIGFERPGGYGEYFITDARLIQVLPRDYPHPVAALIEPLAVGLRAMRRLRLQAPGDVLVFGDGPIGLIMVMLLQNAGVQEITLVGGRHDRLSLAFDLGARHILNYHDDGDLGQRILDLARSGFPNVIEASGSEDAIQTVLKVAAPQGHVLVLGDYGASRAQFRWNDLLHHEWELIGSNASAGAWPEAVHLATSGALPLERLVTHIVPPERYQEAFALARGRGNGVVKVAIDWLGTGVTERNAGGSSPEMRP